MKKERIEIYLPYLALSLLLLLVALLFTRFAQIQPTIPDAIGYLYAGKQLASHYNLAFVDSYNQEIGPYFYLHAFRVIEEPTPIFAYPPGLPLLMSAGIFVSQQPAAASYTVVFLAVMGVLATFWLGWLLTEHRWAGVWAAFLLVFTPLYWQFGTAPWSEIPTLAFITGGVGVFVFSRQRMQSRRTRLIFSGIAALLIGFTFFIRYTNLILVAPALGLYDLVLDRRRFWQEKERWLFWGILGVWGGGVLLFNWLNYGGPFRTIYNSLALGAYPWPLFSATYFWGASPAGGYSFYGIIRTLWRNFHLFLFLVLMGWGLMAGRTKVLSAGIALTTFALYSVYAFAPVGINGRFLLPSFPFMCVAIGFALVRLGRKFLRSPRWRWLVAGVTAVLLLATFPTRIRTLQERNANDVAAVAFVQQLVAGTPENAVFIASQLNDLIAVYGQRSVLNYRRMVKANPETGEFEMQKAEACLVQTVDRLLEKGLSVYFLEEQDQNLSRIMHQHFGLVAVETDTSFLQVVAHTDLNEEDHTLGCE